MLYIILHKYSSKGHQTRATLAHVHLQHICSNNGNCINVLNYCIWYKIKWKINMFYTFYFILFLLNIWRRLIVFTLFHCPTNKWLISDRLFWLTNQYYSTHIFGSREVHGYWLWCVDIQLYANRTPEPEVFLGSAKHAPPGLSPSVVRLPLKIDYPTCHVTAVAVKTGFCVNQWMFVLYKSTNSTKCKDFTVQLYTSAQLFE